MEKIATPIKDVFILQPKVFGDSRGYFLEQYNKQVFNELIGSDIEFVQDNRSRSAAGVLRGLHYQISQPQAKLVSVSEGCIYDVVVDLRQSSTTFGQSYGVELSAENFTQLWVPEGMAHGFLVISDHAQVSYKTTDFYAPQFERSIKWNDPELDINWPLAGEPVLSEKDNQAMPFNKAEYFS